LVAPVHLSGGSGVEWMDYLTLRNWTKFLKITCTRKAGDFLFRL
jgi:hypothetical protein